MLFLIVASRSGNFFLNKNKKNDKALQFVNSIALRSLFDRITNNCTAFSCI